MKRFAYSLYILLIMIVMIPKEKLYFALESILSEQHLFISNEVFHNRFVYLDIENGELLLDHQELGSIEHIRITPWILYNRLSVENIAFSPLYRTFFPGKIDSVVVTYSLLHPLNVVMQGEGDFGHCSGAVDLSEKKVRVVFDPTSELRRYPLLMSRLHQEKEGLVYESNF